MRQSSVRVLHPGRGGGLDGGGTRGMHCPSGGLGQTSGRGDRAALYYGKQEGCYTAPLHRGGIKVFNMPGRDVQPS